MLSQWDGVTFVVDGCSRGEDEDSARFAAEDNVVKALIATVADGS